MKSLKDMVTLNDNCFKVEEILIAHTSPYVSFFKVIECNGYFLTLQNIGTRFISSRTILKAMPKYENGQIENKFKDGAIQIIFPDGKIKNILPNGYEETYNINGEVEK